MVRRHNEVQFGPMSHQGCEQVWREVRDVDALDS
jgi:hypothetical protein